MTFLIDNKQSYHDNVLTCVKNVVLRCNVMWCHLKWRGFKSSVGLDTTFLHQIVGPGYIQELRFGSTIAEEWQEVYIQRFTKALNE